MKSCSFCNIYKHLDEFYKKQSKCKECVKAYSRQYTIDNNERISKNKKQYYKENNEAILEYKKEYHCKNRDMLNEKCRVYYKDNKKDMNEYNHKYRQSRLKNDPLFKTISLLRTRLYSFLKRKGLNKNNKFQQYIGCSKIELKNHLEKQFIEGMNWNNQGEWHIDHIIPLSSAKEEEELYNLCHYTNLQPLWAIDNLRKGGKINVD